MNLVPDANCAHLDAAALKAISDAFQFEILQWALGKETPYPIVVTHEGVAYEIDNKRNLRLKAVPGVH